MSQGAIYRLIRDICCNHEYSCRRVSTRLFPLPVCLYVGKSPVPPSPWRGMCLATYPLPDVPFYPFVSSPAPFPPPLYNTSNMNLVSSHKWSDRVVEIIYEAGPSLLLRASSPPLSNSKLHENGWGLFFFPNKCKVADLWLDFCKGRLRCWRIKEQIIAVGQGSLKWYNAGRCSKRIAQGSVKC